MSATRWWLRSRRIRSRSRPSRRSVPTRRAHADRPAPPHDQIRHVGGAAPPGSALDAALGRDPDVGDGRGPVCRAAVEPLEPAQRPPWRACLIDRSLAVQSSSHSCCTYTPCSENDLHAQRFKRVFVGPEELEARLVEHLERRTEGGDGQQVWPDQRTVSMVRRTSKVAHERGALDERQALGRLSHASGDEERVVMRMTRHRRRKRQVRRQRSLREHWRSQRGLRERCTHETWPMHRARRSGSGC